MEQETIVVAARASFEEAAVGEGPAPQNERLVGLRSGADDQQTVLVLQLSGHLDQKIVGQAVDVHDLQLGDNHKLVKHIAFWQKFAAPEQRLFGADVGRQHFFRPAEFFAAVRIADDLDLRYAVDRL